VKEKYALPIGSKVIVPACTWVTNVAPIFQLGLQPVFCDIELSTFSFDMQHLRALRAEHGSSIRGVFVTHLLGLSAEIEAYKEIFPEAVFLEDICESHGVTDTRGVKRGASSSLGSTFSFYYGHHMTSIEGGMISTNNEQLYNLMRLKRSHGLARELSGSPALETACLENPTIDPRFLFLTDGYNFRNSDLGAVLALSQLKKLDASIAIRKSNFSAYIEVLDAFPDVFHIPCRSSTNSSFCFPFICKQKSFCSRLKTAFEDAGIETRPVVGGNLLRQPFLRKYSHVQAPNADILNDNGFYIGNNQFVSVEQVTSLREVISKCLRNYPVVTF
jgi:CDP-6-deoxy-D-xylo-4-hexulose-3-dehydrase